MSEFKELIEQLASDYMLAPKYQWYTANQPLCLGGQIYMWNRYANVGAMVHMLDAQFTKGGNQNRVNLLTPDGRPQLIVFPLVDRYLKPINKCMLHRPNESYIKAIKTFDTLYGRFSHYKKLRDSFFHLLAVGMGQTPYLVDKSIDLASFNVWIWYWVASLIELRTLPYSTTDILVDRPENPSAWVASMGRAIGCTHYLGGKVAQEAYLREEDFHPDMCFHSQNYRMVPYIRTKNSTNEDATVCILDPLFVGGPDLVRELINAQPF